ncbi:MAG TPA: Arm DNA-binding domain-containing protein [Arachidicoccus sp.]
MEQTHTFGIDFLVRKVKGDPTKVFIYARITIDGENSEISTKQMISAVNWDPKAEVVKGKSIEARAVNEHLADVRAKINKKYRELKEAEELITPESVKEAYLENHFALKGHMVIELLEYYRKIWEPKLKMADLKITGRP